MKLVDYLRALLSRFYSKAEAELVGRQALPCPEGQNTLLYEGTDKVFFDGVASFDGYIHIDNEGEGMSYIQGAILRYTRHTGRESIFLPVVKGQTFRAEFAGNSKKTLRITRTSGSTSEKKGGGNSILNPILQGGLLCLRNTCKLYLKPLSVVRESGSVIREHQIHDTLIGVLLNLGRLESIQPRVMVKLCVELLEQQNVQLFKLKHYLIDCFFAQTVSKTLGIPAIQSPLKRVTRFTLLSDVKPLGVATSSLYQLSDRRSLGFGGALC